MDIVFDTKYTRNTKDKKFDLPQEIYDKESDNFHLEVNKAGQNNMVKDEIRVNWYEQIQSYHDGCALKCLLDKYKQTGDVSILNRKSGEYFDASEMPTTLIDMYKKVQEGEQLFENLPKETKEKFNNSFTEFLAKNGTISESIVNDDVVSDEKRVKKEKNNESEVKTNESE